MHLNLVYLLLLRLYLVFPFHEIGSDSRFIQSTTRTHATPCHATVILTTLTIYSLAAILRLQRATIRKPLNATRAPSGCGRAIPPGTAIALTPISKWATAFARQRPRSSDPPEARRRTSLRRPRRRALRTSAIRASYRGLRPRAEDRPNASLTHRPAHALPRESRR